MAASYPGAVKTFAARTNGQTIDASHVQDLQDEVNAIESGLLNGTAPLTSSNASVGSLTVSSNASITGTLSLTGAATLSSLVTAAKQPRCNSYNSAAQSVSSGTTAVLTLDSDVYNVGSLHSTASNPSRATIPAGSSGLYICLAHAFIASTGLEPIDFYILKNGAQVYAVQAMPNSTHSISVQASTILSLDGTDYVEMAFGANIHTMSVGSASSQFANRLQVAKLW